MSIRTILVSVRGDGKGEGVLDHALAVAKRFNAHISVMHTHAKPEDLLPFGSLAITEDMRKQIIESATASSAAEELRLKETLMDYLKSRDIPMVDTPDNQGSQVTVAWNEETGQQATNVAVMGRLADLIVVAKPETQSGLGVRTLEAALLETGKPVLMAPPNPAGMVGVHVAIAWDGGTESAKAVSATMPLLTSADAVTVFSAPVSTEPRLAVEKLIEYLAWHDIKATAESIDVKATGVGDALLDGAARAGADVLVMGGYGHSRARQLVMGGVTSHIIKATEMPVILVH
ncbi:MAG: universal stress protein [Proteobacteria bacterium]|nr:universal stress protein [Pseudomonadota bacterium]